MMPWFDGNDTLGAFQSVMPKDIANLPQGASTYGLWEYVVYLDELFYHSWMAAAQMGNMGLCGGLMLTAFATRVAFMPLAIYSQMVGHKMKLLAPDTEQHMDNMKRYSKQGNKEASQIERAKLKNLRRNHGIYPMISMLNIAQLPVHMVYISMINRLSYNFDINPAILTDGVLWFKDLSSPDPTGILPIIGGLFSLLNILSTSTTGGNSQFRKFSKFFRIFPLISIPIWMTFPAAFNIYWLVTSGCQLLVLNAFRFTKFRKILGIPDFLPGSKLERLNVKKVVSEVSKVKVFS
jgi:membrane protein insertase Oxa1/YidC/SpoIIIJ